MRMTFPSAVLPDETAFPVLKAALAAGVNPEDADKVVVCIKSGVVDMKTLLIDGSPETVRRLVADANRVLAGRKKIYVFGVAGVDPKVPGEETVRALGELVAAGEIGGIQLSEVGAATIRRAAAVAKIDMVGEEESLWATEIFGNGVAETCAELGIPVVAHTPLGVRMLTGKIKTLDDLPPGHHLRVFPRFQPENFQKILDLVAELEKLAKAKGVSPSQLALSWVKLKSKKPGILLIIPVAGARSGERVKENAETVNLSEEELGAIAAILESFPVYGTRYPAPGMKLVEF
ncbi:NADP-dependent oxidoreductase domain-containing protein [Phialemonium atrogriseum]|uniref:NADP-dependent oxidoreductase domain-containing protein n=1 Tax=Phialemonium atrogriseum TaxID=1093897 RepID=A0AAJ0FC35_9PEZI|nr:NADP-dependent oxidoreductase domain-containing protein [Phialemonium atrogriseum]KAK1761727.1 NADP-dependent oxidoreductase domain-containing protein [Phialemonium atrogriseum]